MTTRTAEQKAEPEAQNVPPPAPRAENEPAKPEKELKCTICGLTACWTK